MNLFFAEDLSETAGKLSEEESHHASRVLRMQPGDEILVTKGEGVIYRALLQNLTKKEAAFSIKGVFSEQKRQRVTHIAIAPTKSNDRFESFLEKATELGVAEITPLICEHSERRVYKTARGKKIVTAAAKQSFSTWWPRLNEPVSLEAFLQQRLPENSFIAHCGEGAKTDLLPTLPELREVLVLIGPEGDFSETEIKECLRQGIKPASLGHKRLRTETAGMAVVLAHNLL